jgi:hypothetical protein
MRGMKISAFGEYGDAQNLNRSLRILEQNQNSFRSFLRILVGTEWTKNNIMLLSFNRVILYSILGDYYKCEK